MKIAYVAGPYRSKWGTIGILINIMKARKVAKELWKMGYAVICPHMNSALMDGLVPDKMFLEGDLAILKKCDMLVLGPDWEKSQGTKGEKALAHQYSIPVVKWPIDQKVMDFMQMQRQVNTHETTGSRRHPRSGRFPKKQDR